MLYALNAGPSAKLPRRPGHRKRAAEDVDKGIPKRSRKASPKADNKFKVNFKPGLVPAADLPEEKVFDPAPIKSPLEYFGNFFSDEMVDLIVTQSILYYSQTNGGKLGNITREETMRFLAVEIIMGS